MNQTFPSQTASAGGTYTLQFSAGTAGTWVAYVGEAFPEAGSRKGTWYYKRIDDYISVALARTDECHGTVYAPFNIQERVRGSCDILNYPSPQSSTNNYRSYQARVRIDKALVSGTYTKNVRIANDGVCQPFGCKNGVIINEVDFSLNVTVPQTCTLNAGQVINIDFGNISSAAFTTAGARPEGVNDIVRNVNISCDNIAANTAMTVRLQADKVSGNAVVTNTNNDVGFVVADGNGTALTPNNLSSVIPFSLGGDNKSSVTIRVYPVSVTGNKPAEGPVTSQAYLRVDFA
ncbi:fimbrial protein [Serratia marcescens]|uniref:fimbrial protein n=1 Tax=Serratia marcescens TaxID=615 RepID=UPI001E3112F3|nr:fimbrial protein [Serratia marcescens]